MPRFPGVILALLLSTFAFADQFDHARNGTVAGGSTTAVNFGASLSVVERFMNAASVDPGVPAEVSDEDKALIEIFKKQVPVDDDMAVRALIEANMASDAPLMEPKMPGTNSPASDEAFDEGPASRGKLDEAIQGYGVPTEFEEFKKPSSSLPASIVNNSISTSSGSGSQSQSGSQAQSGSRSVSRGGFRGPPPDLWKRFRGLHRDLDRSRLSGEVKNRIRRIAEGLQRKALALDGTTKKIEQSLRDSAGKQVHKRAGGSAENSEESTRGLFGPTFDQKSTAVSQGAVGQSDFVPISGSSSGRSALSSPSDVSGSPEVLLSALLKDAEIGVWPEGMPGPAEFLPMIKKERFNVPGQAGLSSVATENSPLTNGPADFDARWTGLVRAAASFLQAWREGKKEETETALKLSGPGKLEALRRLNSDPGKDALFDRIFSGVPSTSASNTVSQDPRSIPEKAFPFLYVGALALAAGLTGWWIAWLVGSAGLGFMSVGARARLLEGLPWMFFWRRKKKREPAASSS